MESSKKNSKDIPFCLTKRYFLSKYLNQMDNGQLISRKKNALFVQNIKNEVIRDINAKNVISIWILMIILRFMILKWIFNFNEFIILKTFTK